MRLTFDFQMDGAEQVSRTLRNMAKELNDMPKGAREGLENLNSNINNILKSLENITSATGGVSEFDKSLQKAFGAAQARLVSNLRNEIEGLEKQILRKP